VILRPDRTKTDALRANFRLHIRYLKKGHAVAALLQLMCQREKGIYMAADGWTDDAKVSQLPEDRSGGCAQTFACRSLCWTLLPFR